MKVRAPTQNSEFSRRNGRHRGEDLRCPSRNQKVLSEETRKEKRRREETPWKADRPQAPPPEGNAGETTRACRNEAVPMSEFAEGIVVRTDAKVVHVLVDGGYVNNCPTDVMRAMGARVIVAVDVR